MRSIESRLKLAVFCIAAFALSSCSTYHSSNMTYGENESSSVDFGSRMPQTIASREKTVVVNPRAHAFGAYANGQLVRSGNASAGSGWCGDLHRPCHTSTGTYRIFSLGSESCKSHKFPLPRGGAPMPYCMYFHGGQALHGVASNELGDGNYSHGCVRLHVSDAEWIRYNFANIGTRVVVQPY